MAKQKFFGVKVSKPGIPVQRATDNQLIFKNDFTTQTFFTNNGSLSFGTINNNNLGMQITDSSGFVLFEMTGTTWKWYDKSTGKNVMQVGLLPDGTYGMAVAKPGYNVSDGIT